jgi:hypothetical protein
MLVGECFMMTVSKVGLTVDITALDASLSRAAWLVSAGILAPSSAADAEGVSVDALAASPVYRAWLLPDPAEAVDAARSAWLEVGVGLFAPVPLAQALDAATGIGADEGDGPQPDAVVGPTAKVAACQPY